MKKLLCLLLVALCLVGCSGCDRLVDFLPLGTHRPQEEAYTYIPDDRSYGYYYDQLSGDSKTVYRSIWKSIDSTEPISIILEKALLFYGSREEEATLQEDIKEGILAITQPAMDALIYDHPDVFWIKMGEDGGSTFTIAHRTKEDRDGNRTVSVQKLVFLLQTKHIPEESTPAAERDALHSVADTYRVTAGTRYDRLLTLQSKLATYVTYDAEGDRPHTAAGALLDGRAVCDGYAKAVKLLCDRMGIPCLVVAGEAVQNGKAESHAWNYIQMEDGLWYALDATWGDRGDHASETYFLVGKNSLAGGQTFATSHLAKGIFSDGDYEPFHLPELANDRYQLA